MMHKKNSSPINTILVISMGMLFIYFIFKWQPAVLIAFAIGVLGLLSNMLALKIEWVWNKLTYLLSLIVPNILMSIVFYIILTPFALLSRLFSNADSLKIKNPENTVYRESNKLFDAKSFENPW
jgi:hypothetical protein